MVLAKIENPLVQALFIGVYLGLGLIVSALLIHMDRMEWFIGATALLLFTVLNSLLSIFSVKWRIYVFKSAVIFVILFFSCYMLGGVLEGSGFEAAREYNLLYMALACFFFGTQGIAVAIRTVVSYLRTAE